MKIIRKVAFIYLMVMTVGTFTSLQPGPPGDSECETECQELFDDEDGGVAYQQCIADCENGALPIDDSILYLLIAGTFLASFVLLKKTNHKKTPM